MLFLVPLIFASTQVAGATDSAVATPAKPAGPPQYWVTNDDFPAAALRSHQEGTVGFTLSIDAAGKVTNCTVESSSGSSVLDETTCSLLSKRASFTPARNAAGQAVAGRFSSRFRWEIPEPERVPIADFHGIVAVSFDAAGTPLRCDDQSFGMWPPFADKPCGSLGGNDARGLLGRIGVLGKPIALTFEVAFAMDGRTLPRLLQDGPGQIAITRAEAIFEISETGKVENCRRVSAGGKSEFDGLPNPCGLLTQSFVPAKASSGEPRRVQGALVFGISRRAQP